MWLEINELKGKSEENPSDIVWDIKPRPQKDYEVRVVVWDTKDLVPMDVEGTNDAFCKAFFDPKIIKETDTHYRCGTGAASFNYRLVYNIKAPTPKDDYTLKI